MPNQDNTTQDPIIFAPETYQYDKSSLDSSQVEKDPFEQFNKWFKEAQENKENLPECATLSTALLPSGQVSSRIVLMKELDHRGFVVYSNWEHSRKGRDIASNPNAALCFFWPSLQRQVRISGPTEFVSRETSQRYFDTRPKQSRIGAWSSPQSTPISGREEFERVFQQKEREFPGENVPCPEFWGGLRILPLEIEFWQGRPGRLHDRFVFTREATDKDWNVTRIAP